MKHGKVEHILQLLLVFVFHDSVVSFALLHALASAMVSRLSSCRLFRKSNKLFWQVGWIEALRPLFLGIMFEFYCLYCVCVYISYMDLQRHCLHWRKYFYVPGINWFICSPLQSKRLRWEFAAGWTMNFWRIKVSAIRNGTRTCFCKQK